MDPPKNIPFFQLVIILSLKVLRVSICSASPWTPSAISYKVVVALLFAIIYNHLKTNVQKNLILALTQCIDINISVSISIYGYFTRAMLFFRWKREVVIPCCHSPRLWSDVPGVSRGTEKWGSDSQSTLSWVCNKIINPTFGKGTEHYYTPEIQTFIHPAQYDICKGISFSKMAVLDIWLSNFRG